MKLSILLLSQKNSKFLAKYLTGFLYNTKSFDNVELLVMISRQDEWNRDLLDLYKDKVKVVEEDFRMGKLGRAVFYNELAKHATGDYLWHMCDDHYLIAEGYDEYILRYVKDKMLNPQDIHILIPRADNTGSVTHIMSRGWYNVWGRIGAHGSIDSYINDTLDLIAIPRLIHHLTDPIYTDFTTNPSIMTPEHNRIDIDSSHVFPPYDDERILQERINDARKIVEAL